MDIIEDTKKFNADSYEKNDKESKRRFKSWFDEEYNFSKQYEFISEGNNDKFEYDAKIKERKSGREVLVEFEMRSKKDFENILSKQYPTIHVPYRKIKNGNIAGTYIIMAQHRKDRVIIIKCEDIKKAFNEGRHENKKCFVDNKWCEETFVNIGHEEVTIMEVDESKKFIGPLKNSVNIIEDDIFGIDVQYIAHQCNCLTSHSAGFAKQVFYNFPEANIYSCRSSETNSKNLPKSQIPGQIIVRGKIINMLAQVFPGKPKFDNGLDSREKRKEYFKKCLNQISMINGVKSIAFPYGIACNMGGGKWDDYLSMITEFAEDNPKIRVFIVKKI
jgi:hypothetical protein